MFIPVCLGNAVHLHWRLFINAVQGGAGIPANASEIEMRSFLGGTDQCNGGIATSSGASFGTAAGAFDDGADQWTSSDPTPCWIAYQFATPVSVRQVALTCAAHLFSPPAANPTNFDLQYSDNGTDWVTLQNFTTTWAGTDPETQLFNVTA